jgi:hypothetical protein
MKLCVSFKKRIISSPSPFHEKVIKMKKEFKYQPLRRWLAFLALPALLPCSSWLTLKAIQSSSILFNIGCYLASGMCIYLSFKLPNVYLTKVITDENGITICRLLGSIRVKWDEVIEYGRHRRMLQGGEPWCYYIKSIFFLEKKIYLGLEHLCNVNELNNIIIKNTPGAKIKNTKIQN